jgi:glycosyltransferase involved in cell wall biosynthesis
VDDCSSDDTLGVAESYTGRLPLRIDRLENRIGPASARNAGAAQCRHPYLLFLDSDVVLPERAISFFRETLALYEHRPDIAGALGCYSEKLPFSGFFSNFKNLTTSHLYRITETQSPFLHTAMLLIRREVFDGAGGFEDGLFKAEDFKLGLSLGSRGYRFVIDWRIQGVHLKEYCMRDILVEDWQRIRALRKLRVDRRERSFSLRAHRLGRLLSLAIPGPMLVLFALSTVWGWTPVLWALALFALFVLSNASFLNYARRHRGEWFAARSLAMLFLEMLWAELALVLSVARSDRRREA